jgi:hypothetical protein
MSTFRALPRLIGVAVSSVLALALIAALAPAAFGDEELPLPPALSLSPVSFPNTTVQTESAAQNVDVVNEGGEEALTESPYIEGPASGEFKITGNGCDKLFPSEHCSISVSFAPGAEPGEKEATLVLPSSNAPSAAVPLHALAVEAILTFEPDPLDFGLVRVNQGMSTVVGVTNSGEGRAHVDFFGFGGPDTNYFGNGNNNCSGAWLEPGQGCTIEVWFNPRETRDYEALLEIHTGPQTFALEVLGTGGSSMLVPETNPVDLGSATAGSKGPVQTIALTNVGNMEGGYFIAVVAGGNSASFQLLDENCTGAPIAPSASCVAHVRFAPQAAGPLSARLALFGDEDGGAMIELHGEGLAPAATLVPTGFDFGATAVGARTAPHAFVVRNDGTGPLELGSVSIVGADLDQFSLGGDECTDAVLGPGEECQVRVRFGPHRAGAKSARLRIASSASPFTATLAGTGKVKSRPHRRVRFARNATLAASKARR